MRDIIQKLSDRKILEAMENGEFDNLSGKGKPLAFDDSHIPSELRMVYKVLKNAGLEPEEVTLKKEIRRLEAELGTVADELKKEIIKQKIADKQVHFGVLMDRRRRGR